VVVAAPLLLVNTVGLTGKLLAHAPRLAELAKSGWWVPLREPLPAVTCTSQAAILTGRSVAEHGIVGNGWYWREIGEIRFWLQSNQLLEAQPFYETARRVAALRGTTFRAGKLFWWFNQGAAVDFSITPKPYYGADGDKVFAIDGAPSDLARQMESSLGKFPFAGFWGPVAGLSSTQWISQCAREIVTRFRPDLTLVYLPHLDYESQRLGPNCCNMPRLVGELDTSCQPILDAARIIGARVWIVNEYGHVPVRRVILPNRALRRAGFLCTRPGPFGENLDTFTSQAFAVCDHQIAHIYVRHPSDLPRVRDLISALDGVACVLDRQGQEKHDMGHRRGGDLVAVAGSDAWFAYPFWLDDGMAPDYARTVDIHRKPGYDPCELFLDPKITWPRTRVAFRLLQKKLGLRYLMDVVPLDPGMVRGSHGVPAANINDRPILIGDGPPPGPGNWALTDVRRLVLQALDLLPDSEIGGPTKPSSPAEAL
jgi:predicted AlkP superfamily pyrophosphatase or phosphodiesterase